MTEPCLRCGKLLGDAPEWWNYAPFCEPCWQEVADEIHQAEVERMADDERPPAA